MVVLHVPWFLLLLIELSRASRIYLYPALSNAYPNAYHTRPAQARLLLSHHIGLEYFESAHEADESLTRIFQQTSLFGEGPKSAFLLNVDAAVARDILPASLALSVSVSDKSLQIFDISSTSSLLLERAQHVYSSVYSSTSSMLHAIPSLLDVFTMSPTSGTETFIAEAAALVSFVESEDNNSFGTFQLTGLSEMAIEFGRKSEQYRMAAETAQGIIIMAMSKQNIHFAVLAGPLHYSLGKRAPQPPQSPLPPNIPSPSPQQPIGSISTCFTSEDACTNLTDSCSGHGSCIEASKAGKFCFVCACNVTLDDNGRREWWAGDACQRKDISSPFVLITGTTVAIILLLVGSVALLQSIGEQKLPPTLTSTSAINHLKRD